ncbi:TcaA NTF2-like domain-containing protein [Alkalicoccobacillus gibsonii]|uniref:TcaA NTF2-like domain-containing protein n=1 Tax=Alkalicoccobacillus gibsonii TaxID=79881 RepID=UPI003F7C16BE
MLDSFLEAVAERDQAAVKKALVSNHPEQDVDDEHVEAFFDVLDNSSEAHGELIQKDVFDRGIRQRFSGAEATNVTLNDDDSYTVETREEYEIRPKDGEYTKRTFEASYKVVYDEEDETWRISELIETNEVD